MIRPLLSVLAVVALVGGSSVDGGAFESPAAANDATAARELFERTTVRDAGAALPHLPVEGAGGGGDGFPAAPASLASPAPPAVASVVLDADGAVDGADDGGADDGGADDGGGRLLFTRTTQQGVVDTSTGPTLPIFVDDLPASILEASTFLVPARKVRPSSPSPAPAPIPASCNVAASGACTPRWTECMLIDPTNIDRVCNCYGSWAACYRLSGCIDTVDHSEILHCFNDLHCTLNQCEGLLVNAPLLNAAPSRGGGAALLTVALVAIAVLANALVLSHADR